VQVRVSKWMATDKEPYYIAQFPQGMGRANPKRALSGLIAQAKTLGFPDMNDPDRIVLMDGEPVDDVLLGASDLIMDAKRIGRVHLIRVRSLDIPLG
jgi:hypothetical protein